MQALLGLSLAELTDVARAIGQPAFVGKQLAHWLYVKHAADFDAMTSLSLKARQALARDYTVGLMPPEHCQRSVDGTVKYLFPTESGHFVESVYIPTPERATLCVSSQVGCKMGCKFCMTGRQGFTAHCTATDILNQICALPERDTLTNIVFMGQGEPMDNLDAVMRATEVLTTDWGFAWSPRRITVSTVGTPKGLLRFLDESDCNLAVSLHHPIPEQRAALMPAERAISITDLIGVLRGYDFCRKERAQREGAKQRRLSFEYIVFKGVNDSIRHADALLRLLEGIECRVNLIRFHDIPDSPLYGVDDKAMVHFRDYLTTHGLFTTIRASRGQDIYAACGLLNTKVQNATQP